MTDEKFNKNLKMLEAWLNNVRLLCDTMQRDSLYFALEKAIRDIKEGNTINLENQMIGGYTNG